MSSVTTKYDKSNLFPLQVQGSGLIQGLAYSVSIAYSYQPSDASIYPLEVGMVVAVTETRTMTGKVGGQTPDRN